MRAIPVSEAFVIAPPRRPAVLCLPGPMGGTDLVMTQWFTWLNLKRQPMLSYALERPGSLGLDLERGNALFLAFPPVKDALHFRAGIRTVSANGTARELPADIALCRLEGLPVEVPRGSELILRCALASAYNYPFRKVRICNCDLAEALKEET